MKQELPNLVDERRFRRREPEHVERDELGRVLSFCLISAYHWLIKVCFSSENGLKSAFRSISSQYQAST